MRYLSSGAVRAALVGRREIALLDVREEQRFAEAHPLFAASLPLGRIELEILDRVPRRSTTIVVYDDRDGLAECAAVRLEDLGYRAVALLEDGLRGWHAGGGELFRDVNVPSKAFGELVEARRHTPSISPDDLKSLLDAGADLVVLDARRFEEYQTMSIPTAVSVPGAELVYRIDGLARGPETLVVVNCAGRTRSIIGAQSLVNAGIPNRVAALRNGTIGWTLANLPLEHGQSRRAAHVTADGAARAQAMARVVAAKAGVDRIAVGRLDEWAADPDRTLYRFDVRSPEEFAAGHLRGFRSAPGGQLVQETDLFAPVRGARIVLSDNDGVRADMTASWLAQMGWDVHVLEDWLTGSLETGSWRPALPLVPASPTITPAALATDIDTAGTVVLDFALSTEYYRGHIAGAWLTSRTLLQEAMRAVPKTDRYVVTSPDGVLAGFAAHDMRALTGAEVLVLAGGTDRWRAEERLCETGPSRLAGPVLDRYKRPYEGTDSPASAMQSYLEWEYGLVAQLERDGTHGFVVLELRRAAAPRGAD
jgi:rhodanese-related sulfurtransferase